MSDWLVSVADVDPDDVEQPGVLRSYLVTREQAEAVMAMLGDPDETALFGEQAKQAAQAAYAKAVHL